MTGSDRAESSAMERLRAAGLRRRSATTRRPAGGAELVDSTAIGATTRSWRRRASAAWSRSTAVPAAELCAEKRLIAIAGTHGKTTTTAMTVWALRALGADPAFFVGGEVPELGPDGAAANAGWGGASGWSPRPTSPTLAS